MSDSHRLEGKVMMITGAASGIGLACAERFVREGAVVAGFDIDEKPEAWSEIEKAAPASTFTIGDVRDEAAQTAWAGEVKSSLGRIDSMLTAAGVAHGGPVHLITVEEWQRVQDINLKGTFLSVKAVIDTMIEQRSGTIITVASIEGIEGAEGGSTYNASKGGVILLTKNLAMDYSRVGIRSNCICPGFIDTPLFQSVIGVPGLEEFKAAIMDQHKIGRFGRPEEIAGAAFFLASDDSSFVTGHAIPVDGGFVAGHRFGHTRLMGLE
ncbi:MAG: oxidoreductase [Deltaproteobacteria bacterium]|nr:oxidoreductase [Deltaproteobacteria bacterium]